MAADETLEFNIFARLREDGFAKAAKAATATSEEVKQLSDRLTKLDKQSAEARVALKGDKEAIAQLDKLDLKLVTVGNRLSEPEVKLQGAARSQAELSALGLSLDSLGKKAEKTTGLLGSAPGGLSSVSGMGALIAAGVALSPILVTVGTGVAGFGAAAAGAVAPVLKAAQATGGLSANMAKLDPEQQKLAKSILGLGAQYKVFEKALEPQVLSVFNKGIQFAGQVMHDVQPVAQATGQALGTMLSAVSKEFASGTWQKFFAFMAKTAGPDIKLISDNFISLLDVLPGVLTNLQPLATALLTVTNAGLKLIGTLDKMHVLLPALGATIGFFVGGPVGAALGAVAGLGIEAAATTHKLGQMPGQFTQIGNKVYAATPQLARFGTSAEGAASASDLAAKGVRVLGQQATATTTPVFNLTAALGALTAAQQKNVDELLTEQGNLLGWQQSLQAATKQLSSNTAGLKGNSAAALANKQAVLGSTQQAEAFAESQSHAGGNIAKATQVIQAQIHWLEVHAGKSKFAAAEIAVLRDEEAKLHDIRQQIKVSASGSWTVQSGGVPQTGTHPRAARGAYIRTGQPGVDDQLIVAQRGELVVPTAIVNAGLTDHLRGMIPGFATGGVIGQYSGSVGGLPPWLMKEDAATLRAVDVATAAATAAGIKSAQMASAGPGMPGPGGGAPAANAALARRLYPAWGSGAEWSAWNNLEIREAGWNQFARNASSGAYGIPQALPPSKMGAAANPPQSNPTAQIRWMIGYIKGRYGDPIGAWGHELTHGWYAQGGVVGDAKHPKKHVSKQQQLWLDQLARDVKVLEADQDHAAKRRKVLRHAVEIGELWFLTHPNVRKHGIGYDEHERALRGDQRRLSHFNKQETDKEKALAAKISILRDLTGYPKGKMYGGQGVPAPPGDGGAGGGAGGGGDTGGGAAPPPAPTGPPPIPPPPEPAWMVSAGLGGPAAPATGGFTFAPQAGLPEPVTYGSGYGGGRASGYGGSGLDIGAVIAAIQAMHSDVVGAVGMVAPGTARGFDRSQNSMAARVAGRFA